MKLALIRETGIIAVMRAIRVGILIKVAAAIRVGDGRAFEVTMITPGPLQQFETTPGEITGEVL